MHSVFAHRPPGAILPGLTGWKPSGIPSVTVYRPWCLGQFQLSFPVTPRRMPRSSGHARSGRTHPSKNVSGGEEELAWVKSTSQEIDCEVIAGRASEKHLTVGWTREKPVRSWRPIGPPARREKRASSGGWDREPPDHLSCSPRPHDRNVLRRCARREGQFGYPLVEKTSASKPRKSCIVPFRELTPTASES